MALQHAGLVLLMGQAGILAADRVALSPGPATAGQSLQQLFKETSPAVVLIRQFNADGKWTSEGSGFLVSSYGLVVTNNHVIAPDEDAVRLSVRLPNGDEFTNVWVVYAEARRDFALVYLKGSNLPYLRTGDSDQVQVGDEVVAIGNPKGLTLTFTSGIVSSVRSLPGETFRFIQHQAPISPGSSGGPLLNNRGEVIGINSFSFSGSDTQNLNGAIPINYVKPYFLDSYSLTWPQWARPAATWTITNRCSMSVSVKFFAFDAQGDPDGVWETSNGGGFVVGVNDTLTRTTRDQRGEKVCYGARAFKGKKWQSQTWGIGLDGTGGCEDCCAVLGNAQTITRTLTCK